MPDTDGTPLALDYSHRQPRPQSRWRRHVGRCPPLLIGFVLLTPVWLFDHAGFDSITPFWRWQRVFDLTMPSICFAAIALPGAIRRTRGWHVLAMLGLAALYGIACHHLPDGLFSGLPFYYGRVFWAALPIALIAIAEWLLDSDRRPITLAWLCLLVIGGSCLLVVLVAWVTFSIGDIRIPQFRGGERGGSFGWFATWPLTLLLVWAILPAARQVSLKPTLRRRVATIGLASASVAAYGVFFWSLMYPMARRSLPHGYPFERIHAIGILETRNDPADLESLWRTVELADWSTWDDGEDDLYDYRAICTRILIDRDPSAGVRLAALLRQQPTKRLVEESAEALVADRRYEAIPVLARIAFLEFAMIGDTTARDALKSLGVWDWVDDVDRTVEGRPAVMSLEIATETDRVVDAMGRYYVAAERVYDAGYKLSAPDWTVPGTAALEAEVQRYLRAADSLVPSSVTPPSATPQPAGPPAPDTGMKQ